MNSLLKNNYDKIKLACTFHNLICTFIFNLLIQHVALMFHKFPVYLFNFSVYISGDNAYMRSLSFYGDL